jgi:hypothetical protein
MVQSGRNTFILLHSTFPSSLLTLSAGISSSVKYSRCERNAHLFLSLSVDVRASNLSTSHVQANWQVKGLDNSKRMVKPREKEKEREREKKTRKVRAVT